MNRTILTLSLIFLLVGMGIALTSCSTSAKPIDTQAPSLSNTEPALPADTQPPRPSDTQASTSSDSQLPTPADTESLPPTLAHPLASPTEAQPAIDGETLLQTRCTECHSLSRITSQRKNQEGWKQTVERMVKKGASLTPEEILVLVQYLTQTYGQ